MRCKESCRSPRILWATDQRRVYSFSRGPSYPPSPAYADPLGIWDFLGEPSREATMQITPIMPTLWITWAVFAVCLLALLVYRGTITRYEDDQLFLDDHSDRQHKENDAIIRKLHTIGPFLKVFTGVTSVLTAAIIGIYAWDAIKVFNM
jgi:hypothetical protein